MTDNDVFTLEGKIPKNGRLDKYLKEWSMILKRRDVPSLDRFMEKVFKDCMHYLKKVLGVTFPDIRLNIYYKPKEYAELCKKLDERFGQLKPYSRAVIVGKGSKAVILIDFQGHSPTKPINFVTSLSTSYLEELVHSVYPNKSETEIHELVCSVVEGFLEIKLPEAVKKERLKRGRIYNGY